MEYRTKHQRQNFLNRYYSNSFSKPVYPFYRHSLFDGNNYSQRPQPMYSPPPKLYSPLKSDLKKIKKKLKSKRTLSQSEKILSTLQNLGSSIKPSKHSNSQELSQLLQTIQKQQESITEIAKSMQSMATPYEFQDYSNIPSPKLDPISRKGKSSLPSLKELGFEDDQEENYLDQEKKYRFNPNLPSYNKLEILNKIKHEKRNRRVNRLKKKLRGKKRLKAFVLAVLFPICIKFSMKARKSKLKKSEEKLMKNYLRVYTDMAKEWVLGAVKSPLISILNEPVLDIDIFGKNRWWASSKPSDVNRKVQKLKVRIKGILEGLIEHTTKDLIPRPLQLFIDKLTRKGTFLPKYFLTGYEKSRLDFDEFGATTNLSPSKQRMIVCFFFITKVLVKMLMVHPKAHGLPLDPKSRVYSNLMIIASLIQTLVLSKFAYTGNSPDEGVLTEKEIISREKFAKFSARNDDEVSHKLPSISEIKHVYKLLWEFLEEMKDYLEAWGNKLLKLCNNCRYGL